MSHCFKFIPKMLPYEVINNNQGGTMHLFAASAIIVSNLGKQNA